jgi:hypothetical protein
VGEAVLVKVVDAPTYGDDRRKFLVASAVPKAAALLDRPEGAKPARDVADAGKEEELRALWVDCDEQGERYKVWRTAACESFAPQFHEMPLEWPLTMMHLTVAVAMGEG